MLRALDPHRVKMHVEFRRVVMIHHSVDVLKMVAAGVLVLLHRLWVRSVPTSTTSPHCLGNNGSLSVDEDRASTLAASHELRHEHVCRLHFLI